MANYISERIINIVMNYRYIRFLIVKLLLILKGNNYEYKDYFRAIRKGYWFGKMQHCINVTYKWLNIKNRNRTIMMHNNYEYFKYKGKIYYIDNYTIKCDFKSEELEFANIIQNLTNKRIEMFPRFDKFKSTDVKIGREYIDFKITTSGTDKFIFNNIKKAKNQSNNFLFWIKNKKVTKDIINYQIDDIFRRLDNINLIGYYRNNNIFIFKRKKNYRKITAS